MTARHLALLIGLGISLVGCARFPTPTSEKAPPPSVVVADDNGPLSTSTPVPPTATVLVTATAPARESPTLQPAPVGETPAALLRSPTPELRATRTSVPAATPVPAMTFAAAPTAPPPLPTATRTPGPAVAPRIGVLQDATTPTPATRSGHYDFPHAQTIAPGTDVAGIVLAPGQTGVHRFDVAGSQGTVLVTVSSPDVELYQATLLSPDGQQSGPGAPVGSFGRQIRTAIKGQTGTWYVEVATDPKGRTPRGPYSIRVDLRASAPA